MPPFDLHLLDALERCEISGVHGTVWRQILKPTEVGRPNQRGARWNPPGVEALYTSLDPNVAAAEIDHLLASQPIPITRQRVTYPITIRIGRVVDLRNSPWGKRFDYSFDEADSAECQNVGAAAAWLGCAGLIARSQRAAGDNLVLYVANLGADDFYEPADSGFDYHPGPAPSTQWPPLSLRL